MSRDDICALRAQACGLMAALGDVLDSLEMVDQVLANPSEAYSDGLVVAQHLNEAAGAADTLAATAQDFMNVIDRHALAVQARVEVLEKGGAS